MVTIDSQKVKALLFDFDGTLILSEQIHYQNFKEVLKGVGVDLMSFEDFIKIYSGKGGQFILKEEMSKHGIDADLTLLITRKNELFKQYIVENGIEFTKGSKELLIQAKQEGFKIGLVTGGFLNNVKTILTHSSLPNVFDVIITNEDIKEPKPSPFGYLLAAENLNLSNTDCIVFEDAANGIESAINADMRCIAISTYTTLEKLKEKFENIEVIKDFTEVSMV